MHRYIIILFLLTNIGFAQIAKTKQVKSKADTEDINHQCVKKNKLNFQDRIKKYPFNQSAQIKIIAFKNAEKIDEGVYVNAGKIAKINDSIDFEKITELKTLSLIDVEKLTNIFYNYGFKGPINSYGQMNCYRPKNAILFYDPRGKIIEYIELCFECQKISPSSTEISIGEMCDQKIDMLRDFFHDKGIKFGIE